MKLKKIAALVLSTALLNFGVTAFANTEDNSAEVLLPPENTYDNDPRVILLSPEEVTQANEALEEYRARQEYSISTVSLNDDYFTYDYTRDWFYNELNDTEKQLYREMYEGCLNFVDSTETLERYPYSNVIYGIFDTTGEYPDLSLDRIRQIYDVFRFSNPQFYFFDSGLTVFDPLYHSVYLVCEGELMDGSKRQEINAVIREKTDEWLPLIKAEKNPLDKVMRIAHIICDNVEYGFGPDTGTDRSEFHQTMAGSIGEGVSVCNGYAMAAAYLCHLVDIPCVGVNGDNHAWNRVKLFGDWYEFDTTWADSRYVNGPAFFDSKWILKSTATFQAQDKAMGKTSHTPEEPMYVDLPLPLCLKDDPQVPDFIKGDVNGSGEIDILDLATMRRHLAGNPTEIDEQAADLDGNGDITILDLAILRRYLAGNEEVLG